MEGWKERRLGGKEGRKRVGRKEGRKKSRKERVPF
jgi:hypothetical protein